MKEYIEMRNNQKFDINVFWKYYKENGGKITNPGEFQEYFLFESQTMDTPMGKIVINRQERDMEEILQGFDKHLGLTILYDENGKFLKVTQWN